MRYKVLLKLSCGHLRLLREVRETPEIAWCNTCEDAFAVEESVDSRPLVRADNGHTY